MIDVVFAFPELAHEDPVAARTVPDVFRVMTAAGPGEPLKVRMRLEALWKRGESFIDEVETALYWITHLNEVEFGEDGGAGLDKQRVHNSDRGKVQLIHVPATRDGGAVTRQALRQLLRRLERSGDFGIETKRDIEEVSETLQEKMEELPAIEWVTERLAEKWGRLHTAAHLRNPHLVVLSQEFTQLLRSLTAKLSPTPDGRERGLDELSEGQTSLFFFALAATLAQLESELAKGTPPDGFTDLDVAPPVLTIYAVEEPENHLAPFYLSRLIGLLGELCAGNQAMGLVTSHAPGVLRRVGPEAVRHFRLDLEKLVTRVNEVRLPDGNDEAAKFVREAVVAQPEIYFASLVVLGEGDSEEVVVPRVANALGIDLDPSFVAFAPLGGRHVNHFWRLLSDLDIPFLTLLDFDLGRHGAGPLRLKYAYDQLSEIEAIDAPEWAKGWATKLMESSMWKTLIAGTTMLMIAGSTLASAQQSSPAERSHRAHLTADDIAAFTDARIAALKAALKLTPSQEKNWPAVEQAVRDISKERLAQREGRRAAGQRTDATERLRDRADALTNRATALPRLADAEKPLYQSLDEAQKRRFGMALRFAARRHRAEAHTHG